MFENIMKIFKRLNKKEDKVNMNSKEAAKERLHLVLMQDRANVSADFLELMKQEIIEVIKKYIDVDENAIDVRLTNKGTVDGTNGAPALYANIPIINIKNEVRKVNSGAEKTEKSNKEEKNDDEDKKTENRVQEKEGKEKKQNIEQKKTDEKTEKKTLKREEYKIKNTIKEKIKSE